MALIQRQPEKLCRYLREERKWRQERLDKNFKGEGVANVASFGNGLVGEESE